MLAFILMLCLAASQAAPTNDVTLYIRALYQDCADANNDSLAVDFLSGSEHYIAAHKTSRDATRTTLATVSQHNVVYFSSRTNYIDAKVKGWIAEGFEQVVVVAAGFDSRAYRIPLNGKFFELDMPSVIADKQEKVKALNLSTTGTSPVGYVAADLRTTTADAALKATPGFDASKKTVYTVEGLIYYLHQPDVDKLFKALGAVAAPGSKLVFDYTNECLIHENCPKLSKAAIKIFLEIMQLKKEPWFSGLNSTQVAPWLASFGFKQDELLSFMDAKTNPELNVTTWTNSPIMGQMNFVSATRM